MESERFSNRLLQKLVKIIGAFDMFVITSIQSNIKVSNLSLTSIKNKLNFEPKACRENTNNLLWKHKILFRNAPVIYRKEISGLEIIFISITRNQFC
jgi:hypothetical protein